MVNSTKKTRSKTGKPSPIQTEIKYDDITNIVEYLVRTKSRSYTFDCYTEDDIGQEIRIICFRALKHFDISRVKEDKWRNFFGRCVDNGLKNLKRDNYLRTVPPCKGDCGFLHGDEYMNNVLGKVCKRWLRFRKNLQKKIKVLHPIPIEIVGDSIKDNKIQKDIEAKDLEEYVIDSIPDDLRTYLKMMLKGHGRNVPRREKKRIQDFVRGILE